ETSGSGTSASRRAEPGPLSSTISIAFIERPRRRGLPVTLERDDLLDARGPVRVAHLTQRQRPELDPLVRRRGAPRRGVVAALLGGDLVAGALDRPPDRPLTRLQPALAAVGDPEPARPLAVEQPADVALEVL